MTAAPTNIEKILSRVSAWRPLNDQWWVRLLMATGGCFRNRKIMWPLLIILLLVGVTGVAKAFWGQPVPHEIGWLVKFVGLPAAMVVGALLLVQTLVEIYFTTISLEEAQDIHRWMTERPELAEAAAAWITPQTVLRQRDYRFLRRAEKQLAAPEQKTVGQGHIGPTISAHQKLDQVWAEAGTQHYLFLLNQQGQAGVPVLPNDVDAREHTAITQMIETLRASTEKLYPSTAPRVSLLSAWAAVKIHLEADIKELARIGTVIFMMMVMALATFSWQQKLDHNIVEAAIIGAGSVFGLVFFWGWWLAQYVLPLSSSKVLRMEEMFAEYPLIRDAFLSGWGGQALTLRRPHWNKVVAEKKVMEKYEAVREDRKVAADLAATLVNLPATQIAAARRQKDQLQNAVGDAGQTRQLKKKM